MFDSICMVPKYCSWNHNTITEKFLYHMICNNFYLWLISTLELLVPHRHMSMVSCQKGPTRHAYAWQIGPFWQDTLDVCNSNVLCLQMLQRLAVWGHHHNFYCWIMQVEILFPVFQQITLLNNCFLDCMVLLKIVDEITSDISYKFLTIMKVWGCCHSTTMHLYYFLLYGCARS